MAIAGVSCNRDIVCKQRAVSPSNRADGVHHGLNGEDDSCQSDKDAPYDLKSRLELIMASSFVILISVRMDET